MKLELDQKYLEEMAQRDEITRLQNEEMLRYLRRGKLPRMLEGLAPVAFGMLLGALIFASGMFYGKLVLH